MDEASNSSMRAAMPNPTTVCSARLMTKPNLVTCSRRLAAVSAAIGRVRWVDYDGKLVDCDEVTVSNFGGTLAFAVAEDVHDVVAEWSSPSR